MGTTEWSGNKLRSGTRLFVNGKEVELGDEISEADYNAGHLESTSATISAAAAARVKADAAKHKFVAPVGIKATSFYASTATAARNLAAGVPRYVHVFSN